MRMTSIFFKRNTVFKRRKNKKNNTVDLPEELVEDILSRVPTASLARFRSISKIWNGLIKDWRFAKKHTANAPRHSLLITLVDFRVCLATIDLRGIHNKVAPSAKVTSQFSLKDPLFNSSEEEQVDINEVAHCDGLLLCTTKDNILVVWNPCSGKTSWIKPRNLYKSDAFYALGRSSCNKYKILKLEHRSRRAGYKYEIYDFTSNSWRGVCQTSDWYIAHDSHCGMYVNGNTYWIACDYDNSFTRDDIMISFDFSAERFGCVPLPGGYDDYYCAFALSQTRQEQKLCLIALRVYGGNDIDVWMPTKIDQSNGAASWSKLLTVERDLLYQHFLRFCNGMNFLFNQENKVFVFHGTLSGSKIFI